MLTFSSRFSNFLRDLHAYTHTHTHTHARTHTHTHTNTHTHTHTQSIRTRLNEFRKRIIDKFINTALFATKVTTECMCGTEDKQTASNTCHTHTSICALDLHEPTCPFPSSGTSVAGPPAPKTPSGADPVGHPAWCDATRHAAYQSALARGERGEEGGGGGRGRGEGGRKRISDTGSPPSASDNTKHTHTHRHTHSHIHTYIRMYARIYIHMTIPVQQTQTTRQCHTAAQAHLPVLLPEGKCLVIGPQFLKALLCKVLLFHVSCHISKDSLHLSPAEEGGGGGEVWQLLDGGGGSDHNCESEPDRGLLVLYQLRCVLLCVK